MIFVVAQTKGHRIIIIAIISSNNNDLHGFCALRGFGSIGGIGGFRFVLIAGARAYRGCLTRLPCNCMSISLPELLVTYCDHMRMLRSNLAGELRPPGPLILNWDAGVAAPAQTRSTPPKYLDLVWGGSSFVNDKKELPHMQINSWRFFSQK